MRGVFPARREWAMREQLVMIKSPFQFCYEVLCCPWVCRHCCPLKLTRLYCHDKYIGTPTHHLTGSKENKRCSPKSTRWRYRRKVEAKEHVALSFADAALLCAVAREDEKVASVGGWDFEVKRLFVVRSGSSQDYQDSKLICDGVK